MPDVFVHPAALVESDAIGEGTRIWAFAHVLAGARIGRNCNIGDHCFIEGGAVLGDDVTVKNGTMIWDGVTIEAAAFIGPQVIFTNDRRPRSPRAPWAADRYRERTNWLVSTVVKRGATLGAGAIVLAGVTIGEHALVAAGSLVTRDVPPHALVKGQPGRVAGWACCCGAPLQPTGDAAHCPACGRAYRITDRRTDGSLVWEEDRLSS